MGVNLTCFLFIFQSFPPAGGAGEGGKPGVMPSALEARMALELNLLDCVDESLRQVDSIERTRAVALAQQETVALAQILKVFRATIRRIYALKDTVKYMVK